MARTKQHHYVPQFILRQFADASGKVGAFDREARQVILTNPKNVAQESSFYTVLDGVGEPSDRVEDYLRDIESQVSQILRSGNYLSGDLNDDERFKIALLLGLQWVRTKRWRLEYHDSFDMHTRMAFDLNTFDKSRAEVKKYLEAVFEKDIDESEMAGWMHLVQTIEDQRFHPSRNQTIVAMLETAVELAKLIWVHPWMIYTRPQPSFITTDQPTVPYRKSRPEFGVGLSTADESYFALSPTEMLAVQANDMGQAKALSIKPIGKAWARSINEIIASGSLRWIFFDPSNPKVIKGIKPKARPAIHYVNQHTVHENESAWNLLRNEWVVGVRRVRNAKALGGT